MFPSDRIARPVAAAAVLVGSARDGSITSRIEPVNAEGIMADRHGNIFAGEVAGNMLRKFARN